MQAANTTCALLDDGAVSCWGAGDYGQLGNNNTANANTPQDVASFPGNEDAVSVAVGWRHACVLLSDQNMSCWGDNIVGQLGDNNSTTNSTTPVLVQSLAGTAKPVALTLNNVHTCALLDDGNAACWGYGYGGQLGVGEAESSTPVAVDVVSSSISDVASGGWHTCAALNNGSVACWGDNQEKQVGSSQPVADAHATFIQDYGINRNASVVRTGASHSCAIDTSGDVQCWGEGADGQLGNGGTSDSLVPVNVSLPSGAKAVDLALGHLHTCALLTNGSVMCWGDGTYGQLGAGWATTSSTTPVYTSALGSSARTGVAIHLRLFPHLCVVG